MLSLRADGKTFAQAACIKSGGTIFIGTKAEWAFRAGVAGLANGIGKKGYYGRDDYPYWRIIDVSNKRRLKEMESILAKVCRARLQ